ncbi:FtsX-like permease family protein [Phytoactinopolyspora limicola]|uniref:FtsX-like permease family protein n=1 Tax=Phytoactinopolyspora limicola TaxID=2715536 RepID=UPI00140D3A2D|nr:ABC transporter permease [Phytoactinopolyspora limicola]
MIWLALATLRDRKVGFVGAFVALFFACAVVTACGILMETGIRGHAQPDRYAAAPVVVAGANEVSRTDTTGEDTLWAPLPERASVPDDVAALVAEVDGVTRTEWLDPGMALGVHGPGHPDDLAARVADVLPADVLTAYTGRGRGAAEFPDQAESQEFMLALSGSFGGIAVMIAIFVVAGTFGLLIQQRRREIAVLRAIGATSSQVRSMILREIQLVAVVAGVLGVLPGVVVARWLHREFVARGAIDPSFELAIGPLPALIAVATGLAVASLAGWTASRRASRINAVSALGEAAVERTGLGKGRVIASIAFLGLGVMILILASAAGGEDAAAGPLGAVLMIVVAVALIGPAVMRLVVRAVGNLLIRLAPTSGYLAVASLTSGTRRFASAMAPLLVLVALAGVTIFFHTTMADNADRQARSGLLADHVLVAAPEEPGVPDGVSAQVRDLPGVTAVTEVVHTGITGYTRELGETVLTSMVAQGVSGDAVQAMDLDLRAGSLDELTGPTVALSTLAASAFRADVGDTVEVHLGDGTPMELDVVAIYGRGLGFGLVTVPDDLVRPHTTSQLTDQVLVNGGDPADLDGVLADYPEVVAVSGDGYLDTLGELREDEAWINYLVIGVLLVYVAVSVVNTLVISTGERARELALLRVVGGSRRQLFGMLRLEALVVAGTAVVIGTIAMLAALIPGGIILAENPIPGIRPLIYAGLVAVAALLSLGAVLVPGRLLLARQLTVASER